MTSFTDRVKTVVKQIPPGQTLSYVEVAKAAGRPGAARAVGTVMKNNYDTDVPCHRVILASGKLGAYNRGGPDKKKALLNAEGVVGL